MSKRLKTFIWMAVALAALAFLRHMASCNLRLRTDRPHHLRTHRPRTNGRRCCHHRDRRRRTHRYSHCCIRLSSSSTCAVLVGVFEVKIQRLGSSSKSLGSSRAY